MSFVALELLNQCLPHPTVLPELRSALEKIERCVSAVEKNVHLADIFLDKKNKDNLAKAFGPALPHAMQLITRLSLRSFQSRSLTTSNDIAGRKKIDFIYRCMGGWAAFDCALVVYRPTMPANEALFVLNPRKVSHLQILQEIPTGSVITLYVKTAKGQRSLTQEQLALDRIEAIFDIIQAPNAQFEVSPAPVVELNPGQAKPVQGAAPAAGAARPGVKSAVPRRTYHASSTSPKPYRRAPNEAPVLSLKVTVSKLDVVVHAGNAHLIMDHVRNYSGSMLLFVLRTEKQKINMDIDSIWSAEVRNGESVLFEFYGPKPDPEFVKELAKRVNKYTQMDKLTGE